MVPVPIVAGVMTAFSSSFLMLNIGRFISSLGIGGIQNTTFTFGNELPFLVFHYNLNCSDCATYDMRSQERVDINISRNI